MHNSKITHEEIIIAIAVVAAAALVSMIIIFSTPAGMQLYGDTLIRLAGNQSHEIGFEAFSKDDFAGTFGLDYPQEDFIQAFEKKFGTENREENFFFVFYDIRNPDNSCIRTKFGINKFADLVYMNERCVCRPPDPCNEGP